MMAPLKIKKNKYERLLGFVCRICVLMRIIWGFNVLMFNVFMFIIIEIFFNNSGLFLYENPHELKGILGSF